MWGVLIVVGGLFLLVMLGVLMAIGSSTINWVMDETVPELDLGMVGNFNTTQTSDLVLSPVNGFIQSFTWISGVIYVFGLLGVFGVAFAFRSYGDKWLIALFFGLVLILVIGCMFLSNIYEDIYNGTDDFASIMSEHVLLSYMIIYSPGIMAIIAFLAGIIMFTGSPGVRGV